MLRWAVDCESWEPAGGAGSRGVRHGHEIEFLVNLLEPAERETVLRFFQASDRKLAIVGRLLARKACSEACGIPFDELQIKRTKGKKPFLANATPELPCFNFNISHEGGMVVLASEPSCVVGVDVCAVDQFGRRRDGSQQTLDEWMSLFDAQLTPHEWSEVQAPGLDDAGG